MLPNLWKGMPRDEQPHWSGRFLLGMVGWIAALFLLFFLFMAFEQLTRDPNNALTMGMVLMAAALGLNRMATRSDLWDQFVLALALAADAWLLYGLLDRLDLNVAWLWFGLTAFSLGVAALFEHWLIRLFHSFAAAILLTLALACLGLHLLALPLVMGAVALCWLQAGAIPPAICSMNPSPWGWHSPCWCWDGCTTPCGREAPACSMSSAAPACPSGSIPALRRPAARGHGSPQAAAALRAAAGGDQRHHSRHGAGALVLVLGFYAGSLALMTLAGLLLLGFGSLYYYDLGLTLMTKSWLLLAWGPCCSVPVSGSSTFTTGAPHETPRLFADRSCPARRHQRHRLALRARHEPGEVVLIELAPVDPAPDAGGLHAPELRPRPPAGGPPGRRRPHTLVVRLDEHQVVHWVEGASPKPLARGASAQGAPARRPVVYRA